MRAPYQMTDANRELTDLTASRCEATNARGEPCRMPRMKESRWCFQHDPETRARADAARLLGGMHHKRPAPEPQEPTRLRSIEDAVTELEKLADDAKRLHHGADRIRVLTTIIRTALDAHTDHTLEARIAALEAKASGTSHLRSA